MDTTATDRKRKNGSISSSSSPADRTTSKPTTEEQKKKHKSKLLSSSSSSSSSTRTISSSNSKVRASHILIKHQGSRRKASWKDPDGIIIAGTTRDAAVTQLTSLRDGILSGESDFDEVAARVSDCSSAKRGGDLGSFGPGKMQKLFEEAAFALKIGEISNIVDTDSGVHIIKRTG